MILDSALDLDQDGRTSLRPKLKHVSRIRFNPDNDSEQNTAAVKELMAAATVLQAQNRTLENRAYDRSRRIVQRFGKNVDDRSIESAMRKARNTSKFSGKKIR
jgi:hypothetical protein